MMLKSTLKDNITVVNHFKSKSEDEIASKMSLIIARLINRNLENVDMDKEKDNKRFVSNG
ncbi:MAG: hypothetical protein WCZ27_02305 [Tissierellaceae bacterium]